MTTTTSTGSITSLGVGSGLDAESIITKLMAVESQPLTQLQQQESDLKTQLSSFGKIQSLTSDLNDASSALASTTLWTQTTATSSDTSYVTASSADGAATGNYSITVDHLATGQTVTSTALPSSNSTLSSGTLSIQLGSYTGSPESAFVAKTGSSAVNITIGAGDTSLASIRDKINAANAGVTASIVNDASGARLSIRSTATGLENGFRITATENVDDGNAATGLSALGFDALSASPMTRNQTAVNAQATINGIGVSSASNTLDNVADGLTLTLVKPTTGAVNVSIGADTASIQSGIDGFVKAFNALASYIHDQTKYDAGSKTGGPLQGNSSAVGLQNQLRAILNQSSSASSAYSSLSDIGIVMKEDGTLETKSSKMSDALGNLTELRKLFSADTGSSASSGFMVRYRDFTSHALDPDGSLSAVNDGINSRIKDVDKRMDSMNQRLSDTEARLRAQYTALDTQMSNMTGLSSYMTAQLAALSKTA
jgi:flagellar hook-associated protein 2